MERPNTVAGLLDKHRELTARLKVARADVNSLTMKLDALDIVIQLFAPEVDCGTLKEKRLPPPHAARKGEFQRIAMVLMRETAGPITSLAVAERFCASRGMKPDERTLKSIRNRASNALDHMKDKGMIRQVEQPGAYRGWVLA
jgi:hypothetical protein